MVIQHFPCALSTPLGCLETGTDICAAPVVSETEVNEARTGGKSVTMAGMNFGMFDFTATAVARASVCDTTSWTVNTIVVCVASSSASGSLYEITVAAVTGTLSRVFTFDGEQPLHLMHGGIIRLLTSMLQCRF